MTTGIARKRPIRAANIPRITTHNDKMDVRNKGQTLSFVIAQLALIESRVPYPSAIK